ncbi:MAG: carbon-nitrogen hydrolase family protein [Chloroflexota bacterium]
MSRKVAVSTVSMRRSDSACTAEDNLAAAERLLLRAAANKPDIVCLPETFTTIGVPYQRAYEVAESVPGPTTDRIGALARRLHAYVVCPMLERTNGHVFNAAVLLDRQGGIAGTYRKIHPTISELEGGVVPGKHVETFATDFGRMSVLICFDIMFPACWREAQERGTEIIFWPSTYEGGLPLQSRANEQECYVVSSTWVWHSQILDITGYPLASTGQRSEIAWAEIDLEKRLFSTDYNMAKYDAILAKYGRRVSVSVLSPEGAFTLESHDPTTSVTEIVQEFGLETQHDYLARSAAQQERFAVRDAQR